MDALIDLMGDLDDVNENIALTTEQAWGADEHREAILRSVRDLRAERNRLEDELDRLIDRLKGLPR